MKVFICAIVIALSMAMEAKTCKYVGGGSDPKWSEKGNWENDTVPESGDDVVVSVQSDVAIEIDGSYEISSLTIEAGENVQFAGTGELSLSGELTARTSVSFSAGLSVSFSAATSYVNSESSSVVVFDSPILLNDGVSKFYTRGKGKIIFNGTLTGRNAVIGPATGISWSANGIVEFNGPVKVKSVIFKNHQSHTEYVFNAEGNDWSLTELAYGAISFGRENACPRNAVLSWNAYSNDITAPNYCSYCFNGFNQTVDRLAGEAAGNHDSHFINPNKYWSDNGKASVLTLCGNDSGRTDVKLVGKLSLIWAPTGGYTQEFVKRNHTMSGFLCVSNGTLRISEGASFANVGELIVAGGVLEVDTAAEKSFAGVTNISVAANGALMLGENSNNPFAGEKVSLELEEGAKIFVPQGKTCTFKSVTVSGVPVVAWSYAGVEGTVGYVCDWVEGGGSVQVLEGEGGSAIWVGGAENGKISAALNWQDGKFPRLGDEIIVASGDGQMRLTKDIGVNALKFSPEQIREFTVVNDDADATYSLGIGNGGIEFAGNFAQTNNLSCPVSLVAAQQTWNLGGVGNLLRIEDTVSGNYAPAGVSVSANGAACEINGCLDYEGAFNFTDGKLFVDGSSFGSDLSVQVNGESQNTELHFNGGVYSAEICVAKRNASAFKSTDIFFTAGSTNEFLNAFSIQDGWHTVRMVMGGASRAVFNGGLSKNNGENLYIMFNGSSSTVEFSGTPLSGVCNKGIMLVAWSRSHEVLFSEPNNSLTGPLVICGATVRTMCDWAFSTDTAMMPLSMKVSANASGGVFDLNGFNQAVGKLTGGADHDPTAIIKSDRPAELHVYQQAGGADTEFAPAFVGAVSLCKYGEDMLSLSGVSTTTGALQVAQGVLAFSGDGAWPSASEVVLKGGELVIDDLARLPRETSYKFLGGKLTIASGVQLVSRSAVVANGAQGETISLDVGVYTKENLPSFIQGDGSLRVKGDGLVILIR